MMISNEMPEDKQKNKMLPVQGPILFVIFYMPDS